MEMAKAMARDPKVVLVDEPFAGLTAGEVADFSALIDGFRRDGRAVLLVDHNVKSVAALVDRVLAMYLGQTHRRGHRRGGDARRNRAPRLSRRQDRDASAQGPQRRSAARPLLEVDDLDVFYGKAQALEQVSIHVHAGEFVSVVGLNGAGKTTLFNAISGLVPYAGDIRWAGASLRGRDCRRASRATASCSVRKPANCSAI